MMPHQKPHKLLPRDLKKAATHGAHRGRKIKTPYSLPDGYGFQGLELLCHWNTRLSALSGKSALTFKQQAVHMRHRGDINMGHIHRAYPRHEAVNA